MVTTVAAKTIKKKYLRLLLAFSLGFLAMVYVHVFTGLRFFLPKQIPDKNSSFYASEHMGTYGVGEVIEEEGRLLTVKNVRRDWVPSNPNIMLPKEGNRYLVVDVLLENKSSEDIYYNTAIDFEILCGQKENRRYHTALAQTTNDFYDEIKRLESGILKSGESVEGSLVWEIEEEDIFTPIDVRYAPSKALPQFYEESIANLPAFWDRKAVTVQSTV